ncbi:MAG: response regulator [Candidatus Hydrothermarchaeaceae archaeon]
MSSKILIVDDDPDFLFVLRHVLTRAGYEVVSAESGREGIEKASDEKPDLVILDIIMPDTDGWEVCRKIKEDSPDIPISMCSILRNSDEIEKSFNSGAERHITKPLNFEEVLDTVRTMQLNPSLAT